MSVVPNYLIHEAHYRDRRTKPDVYSGWFTERDYEQGMAEFRESLSMGFAPEAGRLLDLGCGAGNYSLRLAQLGYTVTGIDISQTAIDWANENATGEGIPVRFVCGDGIQLSDFEDSEFEFAFDGHFLHCIVGPDREVLLANLRRVLCDVGFLMIRSIVWPVVSGGELSIDPDTKLGYLDGTPYRYYPSAEELVLEIERAGFDVLNWRYTLTLDDGYGFQHAVLQCVRT